MRPPLSTAGMEMTDYIWNPITQRHHQVQQTGVDNTGRGLGRGVPSPVGGGVPLPQKKKEILCLKWRVLAHFEQTGVEIAFINSLRF